MSLNNFKEIQIAYSKTFYNGCVLLEESQLLYDNNKYARAYLLAHIAIEEWARCFMLASAIMKFKIRALDVKKLLRRQTSHQDKIELAYSFVKMLKKHGNPLGKENKKEAMNEIMRNLNAEFMIGKDEIRKLNDFKNSSFYVDHYENVTKSPSEMISEEKASELIASAMLLKELLELAKWHEDEVLIDLAKKMEPETMFLIKELFSPNANKY
ncbi:AbiV family abortive infection protein [Sporosarcina psychrophila]|uniref:AbiV family abortive infection protein n=1 Tax=Sporosarcina psychrophila TaxID=1476 RepID=UPI00078EED56|nr:AbiV family abortive infection protein [Sporosarcina psychrophila]AMQ05904.1 hypothetical protein AZE41_08230 [Sporosarcina psychrophila]